MDILRVSSSLQHSSDGALAFDNFVHAFELAGTSITPCLVAPQLAFFGVGLLEFDGLTALASSPILLSGRDGFLHGGVHDHADQFFLGDDL